MNKKQPVTDFWAIKYSCLSVGQLYSVALMQLIHFHIKKSQNKHPTQKKAIALIANQQDKHYNKKYTHKISNNIMDSGIKFSFATIAIVCLTNITLLANWHETGENKLRALKIEKLSLEIELLKAQLSNTKEITRPQTPKLEQQSWLISNVKYNCSTIAECIKIDKVK